MSKSLFALYLTAACYAHMSMASAPSTNGLDGVVGQLLKTKAGSIIGVVILTGSVWLAPISNNENLSSSLEGMREAINKTNQTNGEIRETLVNIERSLNEVTKNTEVLPDMQKQLGEVHIYTINFHDMMAAQDLITLIDDYESGDLSEDEKEKTLRKIHNKARILALKASDGGIVK